VKVCISSRPVAQPSVAREGMHQQQTSGEHVNREGADALAFCKEAKAQTPL
jgi:hypothetical protein